VVALGLTGGLMGTMRDQTVLFLLVPAFDFLRWSLRHQSVRDTATRAAVGALCAIAAFAPHLIASYAVNGYIGPHESVGAKMSWWSPHFFEVLLSPAHGWFAWTPLAILSLAGLVALALGRTRSRVPDGAWIGACALIMVLLQVYINGAVESWTVAG